jgi:hypothetical protein
MRRTYLLVTAVKDSAGPPYQYATVTAIELDEWALPPVVDVIPLDEQTAQHLREAVRKHAESADQKKDKRRGR